MSTGESMSGKRILVVGASSGIGAAIARAAVSAGALVTLSARRETLLNALVADAGGGHVVAGDASVAEDAARIVGGAVEAMGGLDLVVYVAGYGVLQPLAKSDVDVWTDIYRVNVVGANLIAGQAVPHMDRSGIVAFVSSRTVEDANALFSSYSASKAALDQCIRTWRVEHPERRFVRVVMGNCAPTEFANHMNAELIGDALETWVKQGIPGGIMQVDDVAEALLEALAVGLRHPDIDLPELKMDARVDQDIALTELNPTA
jgi:NAD(P)-dependent dehydrogenase (short-subunit alcohol dehydrogenase family)